MRFIISAVAILIAVVNGHDDDGLVHFHGNQVLRVNPTTDTHLELIKTLDDSGTFDFWSEPKRLPNFPVDIMTTPQNRFKLEALLTDNGIKYSTMIEDVEALVHEERLRNTIKQSGNMTWDRYHRLDVVYSWLDTLVAENSDLLTLETIGQSHEGRDIKVLKISTGGSGKPAFWIDSTIHAREWISPAVGTYVINQLVNFRSNYTALLDGIDFYYLPFINPDGYEYTHTNDRMWRKSRSNHGTCYGVDINRNFGFAWGIDDEGSSPSPCSETFRGPSAYSEVEADVMKNYIFAKANSTNWTTCITLHSYSQLWMSPYGYSDTILPEDYPELKSVSDECVAALRALYGTQYTTGAASQILYKSNGSSRDWAKGQGGFKWVYTIELRDTGRYGFLLPPDQILPTAEETWAGLQVLANHMIQQNK